MSRFSQFRDTIAAVRETLRSLSSLEVRVLEPANLVEQGRAEVIFDSGTIKKLSRFTRFFRNLGFAIP
jgi:hypothetical protein